MNKLNFLNTIQSSLNSIKTLFSKSLSEDFAPTASLGVDIGSYSVKVLRLEPNKDGARVLGFAVEKIVDKNVREALSKAIIRAKVLPQERATIAISGQGVVSRYIELPILSKQELESSMKFEMEKYVPFPMADVIADYAVICEMKDKAKMSVLIAAAKNDIVQKKCNLAKEANLNLKAADLDCMALANFFAAVAGDQKKGTCAGIINLGKSVSSIDILVDGVPHLSRDIFMGGDDITKKISETLSLAYAEAEKLKIDPGPRKDELISIWDPVLNNLSAEIRVSLDYFEARNNKVIEKIFITGGSSRLSGIEEYLNHLLGVEIKKLTYAEHLKFDESLKPDDFKKECDSFAIAFGLALR